MNKFLFPLVILSAATLSAQGRSAGSSMSGYDQDSSYYTSGEYQEGAPMMMPGQGYYSQPGHMHDESQGQFAFDSQPWNTNTTYQTRPYATPDSQSVYYHQEPYYNNNSYPTPSQEGGFYSETLPTQHEPGTHFFDSHPAYPNPYSTTATPSYSTSTSSYPTYHTVQSGFGQAAAPKSQEDTLIEDKIQNEVLSDSSNNFQFVGVSVSNGIVTLTGLVGSPELRRTLQERISQLEGIRIRSIDNRVDVRNLNARNAGNISANESGMMTNTNTEKVSDSELTKKIRDALSKDAFTKGLDKVSYTVTSGRVSLRGTVNSEAEKTDAYNRIRSIPGVTSVDNNIQVTGK